MKVSYGPPTLYCSLEIELKNGRPVCIVSDNSWNCLLYTSSLGADAGSAVLKTADYKHYVDDFNAMEPEVLHTSALSLIHI